MKLYKEQTYLSEHKDVKVEGTLELMGILNITPGQTCIVEMPNHEITNQTYSILKVKYKFTPKTCLTGNVSTITLNRKIRSLTDYMKEVEIRLRNLEGAEIDTSVTNLELGIGSISIQHNWYANALLVNNNFVFHSNVHGRFEDTSSRFGTGELGSVTFASGGTW